MVRASRYALGLGIKEYAEAVGVSRTAVAAWEAYKMAPNGGTGWIWWISWLRVIPGERVIQPAWRAAWLPMPMISHAPRWVTAIHTTAGGGCRRPERAAEGAGIRARGRWPARWRMNAPGWRPAAGEPPQGGAARGTLAAARAWLHTAGHAASELDDLQRAAAAAV